MQMGMWDDDLLLKGQYLIRKQQRKQYLLALSDWSSGDVDELLRMHIQYLESYQEPAISAGIIAEICFDVRCPDEDSERLQRILNVPERYVTPTHILL